jgi:hypothetical protein
MLYLEVPHELVTEIRLSSSWQPDLRDRMIEGRKRWDQLVRSSEWPRLTMATTILAPE